MTDSKPAPKRNRARKVDGSFKSDNPATPHNEAWEAIDISTDIDEPKVKYTIKPRVGGTSEASAGKYSKKAKVRPTFGTTTTNYH